ncbi:hypothetical protein E4U43_001902 [Claviceps pusilla]|uniref:Uncharacterized protein n=1 Tax=Claviceps pusilla TaxID=123648 RepID=A0A9P7N7M3_9HYPO|nr:hypothetical protein E4U43_001902 [Claviceps pusilla]
MRLFQHFILTLPSMAQGRPQTPGAWQSSDRVVLVQPQYAYRFETDPPIADSRHKMQPMISFPRLRD